LCPEHSWVLTTCGVNLVIPLICFRAPRSSLNSKTISAAQYMPVSAESAIEAGGVCGRTIAASLIAAIVLDPQPLGRYRFDTSNRTEIETAGLYVIQTADTELYPVSGKKSAAAAQTAGLAPSSISTLLVEGDNRPGLGHAIAKAVCDAGINMSFVMAQVVGRRYSAVFGFENEADASKAATLIKRATARGKK
jgi:hypothetical protein